MPETKPRILATRRLPPNVEARLSRDYRATLNGDDTTYSSAQIIEAADGHDGILCCSTERFSADVISALPESVKILA
ncbi:MAG: D-glycerate dehydrogenase, partial [Gammaproteobacteria bacterium]|nr:D-glycerate dehydrogenase [Gammaproteobacteria bacterium]NIM72272.1 D-glycerate dehydrogenase [Gammaproteobacteria bacterium]NIN39187.1 D-glycerate dehydrogenase [Gammaproteobacteria bacterium]NIO24020.1 D-glycerate dehydrogenase [Gammaproteobacteria bacterium]NIO64672.1 D-glycerate dehydrogenase [Gammaproteobacteria bacterium]